MGNSKFLDSLSSNERNELIKKLWEIQGHKCFLCGKDIDLDLSHFDIDHIIPLAKGGKDSVENFCLAHSSCNRSKKDSDYRVAKTLFKLDEIIADATEKNETPSLKHVLKAQGGSLYNFEYKEEDGFLVYSFPKIGINELKKTEIIFDKLSGEKSAFISVPIEYLYHDGLINPRGINSSISMLIEEFFKGNPQLHVSLARIDDGKIKIFDGQHKAVAQIMLGIRQLTIRLFINPDVDRLIETNTNAGSKLKQIAFDKTIVRQLHDVLYSERIKKYQSDHNLAPEDLSFSEQDLVDYFKGEKCKRYVIDSQKSVITKDQNNRLNEYINFEGRGNSLPLSGSTFDRTFLSTFISSSKILTTPLNYKIDEGKNPRLLEKNQLINLCNMIADELLVGKYNPEIGTYKIENNIASGKGDDIPDDHLIAYRLFKEEVMHAWVIYLKRLIQYFFTLNGVVVDDEDSLFMEEFPSVLWDNIRKFLKNLREINVWKNRTLALTAFGGKQNHDYWMNVFKTGKTPDGRELLVSPIVLTEMIRD